MLHNVTHGDIEKYFGHKITNLSQYVDRSFFLYGRYAICYAESSPEPISYKDSRLNDWAEEWDEACEYIKDRVEWVTEGGRKLHLKG